MSKISANCYWTYDHDDEYRMTFIARDMDGSERPLLTFRAFEQDKFLAVAVLIGEHQDQWGHWREVAERDGHEALEQILFTVHTTEYFENLVDVTFVAHAVRLNTVTVSIHMLPERKVDLISHTFQSSQEFDVFMDWVGMASFGQRVGLCLVGLLKGRQELAISMEKLASHPISFGERVMAAMQAAIEDAFDEADEPDEPEEVDY